MRSGDKKVKFVAMPVRARGRIGEGGMSDEGKRPREASLHVSTLLVASERALANALDQLGFAEDDDRILEHDGKLAFMTCSHDEDCDDLFALIAELASGGETWELQSRIDTEDGRAIFQKLARHQPVAAVDAELMQEADDVPAAAPAHDLDTEAGLAAFRKALRNVDPAAVFATIRTGSEGRASAAIFQRKPRQLLVAAAAADEPSLRSTIREVLPNVMFSLAMKSPG
jgi:hypothetical protein